MIQSPAFDSFMNDLIVKRHGQISEIGKKQLREEMAPRLHKWLILKTMQKMEEISPKILQDFQQLTQGNTPDSQINEYIKKNIPDYDAFLASTLIEFGKVYLGEVPS